MKTLLIVAHTPSKNTQLLANAAFYATQTDEMDNVEVILKTPLQASVEHVLDADAILIGTTENFGYMAGLTKDFFERIFYPVLEVKQGLPVACYIRAGLDGTGATRAIDSIVTGLRWKWVQPPLVLKGNWQENFEHEVTDLAATITAGLSLGIL